MDEMARRTTIKAATGAVATDITTPGASEAETKVVGDKFTFKGSVGTSVQLRLINEVWDDLSEDDSSTDLTEDLKDLLDRRIKTLEENPDAVVPWEIVEARALSRFQK